jgi:lipopolysaccharide/colanic/teichoic acid biosynthesis glycosyltransferase
MAVDVASRSPIARAAVKRMIDLVIAAVMLIVLGPIMAAIALAILISDGRPVLFRQQRPGLHGTPFCCLKFRTMRDPQPGQNRWTTDADRVTGLGRLLRRTSLDELPELLNVLRGEMSLVGPRPLLMEYLGLYSPEHQRRHDMRPGLTGLAQTRGRRALTLSQRLDLDVQYVRHWTVAGDFRILLRTLVEPFRPGDIEGQQLADVDDLGFHKLMAGSRK